MHAFMYAEAQNYILILIHSYPILLFYSPLKFTNKS